VEIRLGSLETAVTVSTWFSLADPLEMPLRAMVCGPLSSTMIRSLNGSSLGGWLTVVTVSTKEPLPRPPEPSATVSVITAEPN